MLPPSPSRENPGLVIRQQLWIISLMLRFFFDGYPYRKLLSYNFSSHNIKKLRILKNRFSEIFSKSHIAISYWRVSLLLYLYIFTYILWYLCHSWHIATIPYTILLYCLPYFSNLVLHTPLPPFRFEPSTLMHFLLPYFFEWMSNHATFDVIMSSWCYIIWCFDPFLLLIYILYFVIFDIKNILYVFNQLIPSHGQSKVWLNCL